MNDVWFSFTPRRATPTYSTRTRRADSPPGTMTNTDDRALLGRPRAPRRRPRSRATPTAASGSLSQLQCAAHGGDDVLPARRPDDAARSRPSTSTCAGSARGERRVRRRDPGRPRHQPGAGRPRAASSRTSSRRRPPGGSCDLRGDHERRLVHVHAAGDRVLHHRHEHAVRLRRGNGRPTRRSRSTARRASPVRYRSRATPTRAPARCRWSTSTLMGGHAVPHPRRERRATTGAGTFYLNVNPGVVGVAERHLRDGDPGRARHQPGARRRPCNTVLERVRDVGRDRTSRPRRLRQPAIVNDVWFVFTPPVSGDYRFDTETSARLRAPERTRTRRSRVYGSCAVGPGAGVRRGLGH